jgi:preprotein translocase subunit YajC
MISPLAVLVLLQDAPPEAPASPGPPGFLSGSLVPIVLILGIFYVVLILPERKKQKKHQSMLDALKKGDRVMTSGGIHGNVVQVANDVVVLQVADNVRMRFARAAVQTILTEEPAEKASEAESREASPPTR